jgi:ribose transport system ATP-binding protein
VNTARSNSSRPVLGDDVHAQPQQCARMRVLGASKTYGSVRVLADVDVTLAAGEVHALVGQNGSGKSTLVKILSGVVRPDPGAALLVDGASIPLPSRPELLNRLGLSFVHQDLGLISDATVVENIRMGRLGRHPITRRIRWASEIEQARETLRGLHCAIDPRASVDDLPPGQRALVAIARALQSHEPGRGCIVFDESTQSLPRESLGEFYDVVGELAAGGTSVLLVSHRLDEVLRLADRVTVLQDGRVTARSVSTEGMSESRLATLLLGREVELADLPRGQPARTADHRSFRATGLRGADLDGLDLEVAPGEILGITGVSGSGHEVVPGALSGARAGVSGHLDLPGGAQLELGHGDVDRHIAVGITLVPERRAAEGLALEMTALENLTLPRIRKGNPAYLRRRWQQEEFEHAVAMLGITPSDPNLTVSAFSGGNQQKILLAKWLLSRPDVLVLHEPTQAVDVGARVDILRAVRAAANAGAAVIISSVEAQDLAYVCDRVIVLRRGRASAQFESTASHTLSAHEILEAL